MNRLSLMAVCVAAGVAVSCGASDDAAPSMGANEDLTESPPAMVDGSTDEVRVSQLEVGDFTFDLRSAGPTDGEVVILLHGFPQTSYEWRHQLNALGAAGFHAVAPDQRGYSPGARPAHVEDYAVPLLRPNFVRDPAGFGGRAGGDVVVDTVVGEVAGQLLWIETRPRRRSFSAALSTSGVTGVSTPASGGAGGLPQPTTTAMARTTPHLFRFMSSSPLPLEWLDRGPGCGAPVSAPALRACPQAFGRIIGCARPGHPVECGLRRHL